MTDFVSVTEVAGDDVTTEQVERLVRRYAWAAQFAGDRDVLEAACGTAPGLGFLGARARSVTAGDLSEPLLRLAQRHYGGRFALSRVDAQAMPFADATFDVVILFEALYYLPNVGAFFEECRRVLRSGGFLLLSTANKDLFDFNPSPHSHRYLGVSELTSELAAHGFTTEFWGDTPASSGGVRQRLFRPLKAVAAKSGLIPDSMTGKKLLKRLVYGSLVPMPAEIASVSESVTPPASLAPGLPDRVHKVIFCAARSQRRVSMTPPSHGSHAQ